MKESKKVILWGVSVSPYVRKVMAALREKNIVFEQKEILPKIILETVGKEVPHAFLQRFPKTWNRFLI